MSGHLSRKIGLVLFAFSVLLLVGGCGPVAAPGVADEASTNNLLTRAMTSEPARIDPQGPAVSGLSLVLPYLFDTLVARDVDNTIVPVLAENWSVSDDGRTVTMQLRSDVTFQDGTPFNADAVKYTFDRFKEVGTRSPIYSGIMQISDIEVVDDTTVHFSFEEPAANFWSTISMPFAAIVSPDSARKVDETGEGYVLGTGPFVLEEWKSGQSLTMARNEDYRWGPAIVDNRETPYLDGMVFKVIPDATTQLAALENEEVDVIFINQPSHKQKLESNPAVNISETVLNSLIYLGFNTPKPPFDEVLVRQALSHAVNKEDIVELALGGLGIPAFAPLPPTLPGFEPSLKEYEMGYDVEKSKELLIQAGFNQTDGGTWERDGEELQARLLTSTRPPNEIIATLLQSQLQAIGVPVEIQQLDAKAVVEATNQGNFDLLLWRYDWNDPDALKIFLSTERMGRTNRVAYSNPDVDQLLEDGARELDDEAREAIYVEAQKLILQDAPWQPLYNPIDAIAINDRIHGATPGYMGRLLVNDAHVVEK